MLDFVNSAFEKPLQDDRRVAVLRAMNDGGRDVNREGRKALNDGSPEALDAFLQTGMSKATFEDNRVRALQLMETGGPALREAGKRAMNGTPQELVAFLENGQYLAQARDQELMTVTHGQGRDGGRQGSQGGNLPGPGSRIPRRCGCR
ncbi:ALF repeat-containing protein [Streptomyces xanthochromogenes]|uniref:ALF repeat-containing protein n=1 Tax=Streptomyces xanthochromogenes TaxID=67384 RepID=UPI00341FDBCE